MTDKEKFFERLEALGEAEVRSRIDQGHRSPFQRRHMGWAREWIVQKEDRRAQTKEAEVAQDRKEAITEQKRSNRLTYYLVLATIGLLCAAVVGLYLR